MERIRLFPATLADVPPGVPSCVHCRTVTWAGVPACDCEFGRLAVDEEHTAALAGSSKATGQQEARPLSG